MVVVFSNVIADISSDFVQNVANGGRVDFLGMLRRVCKDAQVEVIIDITKCNEYKLKGTWRLISKAHSLLLQQSTKSWNTGSEIGSDCIEECKHLKQIDSETSLELLEHTTKDFLQTESLVDTSKTASIVNVDEIVVKTSLHNNKFEHEDIGKINKNNNRSSEEDVCVDRKRGKRKASQGSKKNISKRCLRQTRFEGSYAVDQESEEDSCKNIGQTDEDLFNLELNISHELHDQSVRNKEKTTVDKELPLSSNRNGSESKEHSATNQENKFCLNNKVRTGAVKKQLKVTLECSNKINDTNQSTLATISALYKEKRANKRKRVCPQKVQNIESTMSMKRNIVKKTCKRFDFSKSKFSSLNRQLSSSLLTRSLLLKKRGRPKKCSGVQSNLSCSECDFVAKTRNALGDHKHRVHLAKPSKCDVCEKVFPNARYMKRHRASHVEPQHCCDICGKMYKILKALRDHRKTHDEGYARPQFPCSQCSKKFCTRYIMECHIKSEHLGQKRSFLCSTCGKSFTTKHTLQQHVNVHSGVKPYTCGICSKSFSYESALRDHKYIHAGMKKFVCLICHKAFRQRSALKMHEKIHLEKKEFTCQDCGRGFTQKQALQRHERAHKGLKPFSCKLCGRTFGDASIIRRHMILVHKINKDPTTWREDIIMKTKPSDASPFEHVQEISIPGKNKNKSSRLSKKSVQKSWTVDNIYSDENCQKPYKNMPDQEAVMTASSDVLSSTAITEHQPPTLLVQTSFHSMSSSAHPVTDPCSVQSNPYQVEMTPHLHNIEYQYPNAHNLDPTRMAYPSYMSSGSSQVVDPRYQRMSETTASSDESSSKRLHEMEPPDNLSISSLYAYYSNLASQYINVNAYPNYMPPSESSNQEH